MFDLEPRPSHAAILLVHVIEHFRSPREALLHMHRLLKPDGRLYVECPNLGAPFTTRGKLFHFAHIHNFTPTTLAMMARRCGFLLERQFSRLRDSNLQMLFRRVETVQLQVDPTSVSQTLAALTRYNRLTYHLRWNYLAPRVAKLASYAVERLTAERFVERLLHDCGDEGRHSALPALRDPRATPHDRARAMPTTTTVMPCRTYRAANRPDFPAVWLGACSRRCW